MSKRPLPISCLTFRVPGKNTITITRPLTSVVGGNVLSTSTSGAHPMVTQITPAQLKGLTSPVVIGGRTGTTTTISAEDLQAVLRGATMADAEEAAVVPEATQEPCIDGHNCPGDEAPAPQICTDGHNCPGDETPAPQPCTDGHNCPGDEAPAPQICADGHNCPGDEAPAPVCTDGHNCPGDEVDGPQPCTDGHNCPGDDQPAHQPCTDGHNCPGDDQPTPGEQLATEAPVAEDNSVIDPSQLLLEPKQETDLVGAAPTEDEPMDVAPVVAVPAADLAPMDVAPQPQFPIDVTPPTQLPNLDVTAAAQMPADVTTPTQLPIAVTFNTAAPMVKSEESGLSAGGEYGMCRTSIRLHFSFPSIQSNPKHSAVRL